MSEPLTFTNLVNHFNTAKKVLKVPKLVLENLKLHVANNKSKYNGDIMVTNGKYYGEPDSIYFGRISTKTNIFYSNTWTELNKAEELAEAIKVLKDLNHDPTKVAVSYFKATGSCMFCGRTITTNESLSAGYGPICAENWGLPWGNVINEELESL